jgi:hypothetical protein
MSLYKAEQTTLYFKKLAEREDSQNGREANAPRIRQSRAARVMSLKNDLVCIKDVAAYHDVHQA